MRTTLRHVRLPNGLDIEYAEQGPRGGPSILMLHGITDSWRSFEPVLPWLPLDWHVISMTQRGHGGSSTAASYRTRDFAADASALMAMLGLAPVLVVGHSMGAVNALRLAIDHPAAVRGVVAAGGFASFSDKPELVDFVRSQMLTLGEQVPRELAESFQRDTVAGPVAPGLIDTMVGECLRTPAATWRGAFAALLDDDFSAELHQVEVPVLLPWGDADVFSHEPDQQRLQQQLAQATRVVYAGVGHSLHWEQPRRFAADLVAFEQMLTVTLKSAAVLTRRGFAAVAAALALRPALAAGMPARVGVLVLGSAAQRDDLEHQLLRGLNQLGYVEGRNLVLERRYADSQASRLPGFAQEFAARGFDVIVTTCTPSTRAARGATQRIPIVMVAVADPVGSAFVESLAQPGTNITGRSSQSQDIVPKMMSLFLRAAPRAGPMAVLVNADNIAHEALWRAAAQAAPALRLPLRRVELRSAQNPHGEDLAPAFERLSAAGAGSVFMLPDDPISVINRTRLVALAAQYRLPALYGASEFTEAGGLMSYGENLGDSARQSARHVARLLEGADPATLPVEQPTHFELVLNLKTAQALRLNFPQDLRLLADRVI